MRRKECNIGHRYGKSVQSEPEQRPDPFVMGIITGIYVSVLGERGVFYGVAIRLYRPLCLPARRCSSRRYWFGSGQLDRPHALCLCVRL